jgi:preprotein translocase subunit SecG
MTIMLFAIIAVAIVCIVALSRVKRRGGDASLGSMSEKWLAENRASRH